MVMGPAGVGKSTYCKVMQEHAANSRRKIHIVNLDPAADSFEYDVAFDVRDLITVADVMDELELGPNGSLIYCMEYLLDNVDWLKDELDAYDDDEYIIFDCPGQIELYSHIPVMKQILDLLKNWGFTICGVYALDATFMSDVAKFISGTLLSLSAMVSLELPHLNILTKCDLADMNEVERFLDEDSSTIASMHSMVQHGVDPSTTVSGRPGEAFGDKKSFPKLMKLTSAIAEVIDEYSMVGFLPLDVNDEETIALILHHADHLTQYYDGLEPRDPKDEEVEDDGMMEQITGL